MHPTRELSADIESRLGDLTTTHTWFKEHVLNILGVLITLTGNDHQVLVQRLAGILLRPESRIIKAAEGVELLAHMPTLKEKVTRGATLDVDMLATIAAQANKFEDIDYEELEQVLTTIIYGDTTCTTPAKLNAHIRSANYKRCVRKATRPARKAKPSVPKEKLFTSAPPQGLANESYQLADSENDAMVFDPETSTCHIRLVCTPSHFNLMKRLVEGHASGRGLSFKDALMRLIGGQKRPRINLYAIGVPGDRLLVEGRGWINTEDLDAQDLLILKDHRLTPNQLAELLIGDTSLDAFAT